MSDLISRSKVIELLYKVFDEYRISTDKTSTLEGFGSEVFKRVREMSTVYDIDKVVDELKELKAYAVYEDINADTKWLDKAIEIVKHDCVADNVCEWKAGKSNDEWKPNCEPNSTYNVFGVAWFRKCPYCGKKIKVVEQMYEDEFRYCHHDDADEYHDCLDYMECEECPYYYADLDQERD